MVRWLRIAYSLPLIACSGIRPLYGQAVNSPERTTPQSWLASLAFTETWTDNAQFSLAPRSDLIDSINGQLSYTRVGSRGRLTAGSQMAVDYFRRAGDFEILESTFSASGSYQLSRRVSLSLTEAFVMRADAQQLVQEGLILPRVRTYTNRSSGSASYRLSRKSGFRLGADQAWTQFGDSILPGGRASLLDASFSHRPRLGEVVAGYAYQSSSSPDEFLARAHSLSLGVTARLRRKLELNAGGGVRVTYVTLSEELSARSWIAHLVVARRTTRSHLSAGYDRSTAQAFGFGRQTLTDAIIGRWASSLGRISASVFASFSRSQDLFDPDFSFNTLYGNANFRYDLRRGLGLYLDYDYRRFERLDLDSAAAARRLSYGILYTRAWK